MKYYFKYGRTLKYNTFNVVVWLSICCIHVFWPRSSEHGHFYLWIGVFWLIATFLIIKRNYHLIKFAVTKQAILEVDEACIFDRVNMMKYYWDDIEEVTVIDDILLLLMYQPEEYTSKMSAIMRFRIYSKRKKVFRIDLDCVKSVRKDLVNTLDDFSVRAIEIQQAKM